MKPNFELSLSFDGIELHHLKDGASQLVGQADLSSTTLGQDLSDLQSTALKLVPKGLLCKVIIPDEQIRYLSIETHDVADKKLDDLARDALTGATPYDVDDLVFDLQAHDDTLQIAAIAQETLTEAENFVEQHGFDSICFAAKPSVSLFEREVNFGPTRFAEKLGRQTLEEKAAKSEGSEVGSSTEEIKINEQSIGDFSSVRATLPVQPKTAAANEVNEAEFVSVRKVPTFRTDQKPELPQLSGATDGALPDFGTNPKAKVKPSTVVSKKQPSSPADVVPPPRPVATKANTEAERLTVFGARDPGGQKPKVSRFAVFGGVFAVALFGIAMLIGGQSTQGQQELSDGRESSEARTQFAEPLQPEFQPAAAKNDVPEPGSAVTLAALDPALSEEDEAVLEALRDPIRPDPEPPAEPSRDDILESYAVTGIWPAAPDVPSPPPLVDLEDMYVTSIDPINPNFDAVALPDLKSYGRDVAMLTPRSPAPATTTFALDDRGFVIPTPDGALNPDGIPIFAGPPPVRQPDTMLRIEEPGEDLATRMLLAGFRPNPRPSDLAETTERATLSGLTRTELGGLRPRLRPQSAQETARAAASLVNLEGSGTDAALIQPQDENDFDGATARAVAASLRPDARPNNFSAIVARVQRQQPEPQAVAAAPAPRTVAPQIPSSASAAREATVRNAINLRKVNLIGVYGSPSSRRALVRLGNGRYRKVEVGDRIDGGRVSAIGDSELRYQKSGRAIVLKMPQG